MPRVLGIVGMHRSGTSCLAGTLEEAGLHLGRVIVEAPHNAKGNRENRRIMDLHEAILVYSGGAWDRLPLRLCFTDEHRRQRDAILAEYEGVPQWGFKDPRTLVTLPFWEEALGELEFVGTFRHPSLVAASLVARNGGDKERWQGLWADYNERLLALHSRRPFPVVRFDVTADAYRAALKGVALALGLDADGPLRFFEPELRHQKESSPERLPPRVEALLNTLEEKSRGSLE